MVHHFMSTQEVRLSGFLDTQTGIVLGKERTLHEPLVENSRGNVLLAGPAPLEKFHSVLYPTALAWKGSAFFLDTPDGMLYASTAGKRREKFQQETFLFRLSDDASVRWNPLDEIRWETWEEEEDAKCVASAILETSEVPFAYSTYALKLLPAVFRYLYAVRDGEAPVTLQGAYAFFRQADEGFLSMRYVPQVSDAAAFYRGLETYEKEQLKDLLLAVLEPFQQEEVSKAFSSSDFSLRGLLDPQHPFSLYLALDTGNPMVCRFFIQLALELFTNKEPRCDQKPEPHLLISLDAPMGLGRIPNLELSTMLSAWSGVRYLFSVRDFQAIDRLYGKDSSLASYFDIHVLFAPASGNSEQEEAIQRICGKTGRNAWLLPVSDVMHLSRNQEAVVCIAGRLPLLVDSGSGEREEEEEEPCRKGKCG